MKCEAAHDELVSLQCSVTCGVGRSTRRAVCMNYHHQVDESFCHPDEKPNTEQECAVAPCQSSHQWPNNQPHLPNDPGSHPGHDSWNVPSADNQWRTGPWGAVRHLIIKNTHFQACGAEESHDPYASCDWPYLEIPDGTHVQCLFSVIFYALHKRLDHLTAIFLISTCAISFDVMHAGIECVFV